MRFSVRDCGMEKQSREKGEGGFSSGIAVVDPLTPSALARAGSGWAP